MRPISLRLLLSLTSILLGIGLAAPCMTIKPHFAEWSGVVGLIKPSMLTTKTFSVIGGVGELLTASSGTTIFVGVLVALFSVVFPITKLIVLDSALRDLAQPGSHRLLKVVEKYGKFSMIDVFVLALLVLAIKGLPGGSEVRLEWGLLVFAAAAVLPVIIGNGIKSLAEGDEKDSG